ncbi:hypothetical protein QQF64_017769, partial [Cirrhinus molitorella]
ELLSQPRPEGLTEIICPKNGSERVNVALVYPPTPTVDITTGVQLQLPTHDELKVL